MILEVLPELMKNDGVVAIATLGEDGPHMVNTWTAYLNDVRRWSFVDSCWLHAPRFAWLRATMAVTIESATQTW